MPTIEDDEPLRLALARFPLNVKETSKGVFGDINEAYRLIWLEGYISGLLEQTGDTGDTNTLMCYLSMLQNVQDVTQEITKSPETVRKYLEDRGVIPKTEPDVPDNLWCDVRDIFIHRKDALQILPNQFTIKKK